MGCAPRLGKRTLHPCRVRGGRDNPRMRRPALTLLAALACSALLPAQKVEWWQKDMAGAIAAASSAKAGMTVLYCWKDGDPVCKELYEGTVMDASVQAALAEFVCMGAKYEEAVGKQVHDAYGVTSVPTMLFVKPDGKVEDVLQGVLQVKPMLDEIARIRSGKETIGALRTSLEAKPDDHALALRLARKLAATGDKAGAAKLVDGILAKDPKFASEAAAEAMLMRICEATFRPEITPQDVDLKPLREFLVKAKSKRIQFLGWDRIAAAEWRRQNLKAATEAVERAWKNIPPEEVMDWGNRVVAYAYEFRAELDKNQQKLALEIAKKSVAAAETAAKAMKDGNPWLAERLYTFAACQLYNNLRKEAFATMERAIQLDPKNENLKKALEMWKDGAK